MEVRHGGYEVYSHSFQILTLCCIAACDGIVNGEILDSSCSLVGAVHVN